MIGVSVRYPDVWGISEQHTDHFSTCLKKYDI